MIVVAIVVWRIVIAVVGKVVIIRDGLVIDGRDWPRVGVGHGVVWINIGRWWRVGVHGLDIGVFAEPLVGPSIHDIYDKSTNGCLHCILLNSTLN